MIKDRRKLEREELIKGIMAKKNDVAEGLTGDFALSCVVPLHGHEPAGRHTLGMSYVRNGS